MQDFIRDILLPSVGPVESAAVDPVFAADYPRLWAFLSVTQVTGLDGQVVPRKPATISIYLGMGGPQAFLNDRACSRCLTVTSQSFEGLWGALEDALSANPIPWRILDGWQPEKKTTKRARGG